MIPDGPYIPGLTARPEEGAFDHLKEVSEPLRDCAAWRAGVRFYEAGFFWEAHEVWEAVWMAAPERSADKLAIQAAIQMANARLKLRMGRGAAADKLEARSMALLEEAGRRGEADGMGVRDLLGIAI